MAEERKGGDAAAAGNKQDGKQEHEKEVKHSGGATEELIKKYIAATSARASEAIAKSMNGAQLANHWQHIPLAIEAVPLGYNMQAKNVPEAQQYNYNIRSSSCRYLSSSPSPLSLPLLSPLPSHACVRECWSSATQLVTRQVCV